MPASSLIRRRPLGWRPISPPEADGPILFRDSASENFGPEGLEVSNDGKLNLKFYIFGSKLAHYNRIVLIREQGRG